MGTQNQRTPVFFSIISKIAVKILGHMPKDTGLLSVRVLKMRQYLKFILMFLVPGYLLSKTDKNFRDNYGLKSCLQK